MQNKQRKKGETHYTGISNTKPSLSLFSLYHFVSHQWLSTIMLLLNFVHSCFKFFCTLFPSIRYRFFFLRRKIYLKTLKSFVCSLFYFDNVYFTFLSVWFVSSIRDQCFLFDYLIFSIQYRACLFSTTAVTNYNQLQALDSICSFRKIAFI